MENKSQINLRREIVDLEEEMVKIRRHLHENPELGYEEIETAKYIVSKLKQHTKNLKIIQNVGKTGVVAILEGQLSKTPCILLRADMDALPLQENSGETFSSKVNGKHHACGHDGHVAMLLAAAMVADKWVSKIRGTIKFCFQPAEEGGAGARAMIQDKENPVLDNPYVDKCYGIHLSNMNYPPFVGVGEGSVTANSDRFEIKIKGKGGHAMAPHQTIDAVLIGCQLVQAVYSIITRNINPVNKTTISVGKIEGGSGFNIVASDCFINGSVRCFEEEDRQTIIRRMSEICKGFETSFACKIDLDYITNYNSVVNDPEVIKDVVYSGNKIAKVTLGGFGLAGEDFSFFSAARPSAYFVIGSAPEGSIQDEGKVVKRPHHSPFFTFDEKSMLIGASTWVQLIEDQLINIEQNHTK